MNLDWMWNCIFLYLQHLTISPFQINCFQEGVADPKIANHAQAIYTSLQKNQRRYETTPQGAIE